jgi:hypothetical protein
VRLLIALALSTMIGGPAMAEGKPYWCEHIHWDTMVGKHRDGVRTLGNWVTHHAETSAATYISDYTIQVRTVSDIQMFCPIDGIPRPKEYPKEDK